MILQLLQAIYTKAAATSAIVTAFPGWTDAVSGTTFAVGYYRDVAPKGSPLPFVVSTVIAAPNQLRYGGIQRTEPLIQFAAYGADHDATAAKLAAWTTAFDDVLLTLSSGHMANTVRTGDPIPQMLDEEGNGSYVWQWVVSYQFTINP